MCRQRRDLNTNYENKGNALHSRNQTSDVLFLFRYSRTSRMKISARICMWLAGGKKGFHLHVTSRFEDEWETNDFALDRDRKGSRKREVRMKGCTRHLRVYTLFPLFLISLEEFDD